MSKKTLLILIIVAGVLGALLAICATAGYIAYRAYRVADDLPSLDVTPESGAPPAEARGAGGVLRLAGGLPPTLDPAMAQDSTSAEYIAHLFSGLVSLDSKLDIVPDLAEKWEFGEDGRTFTFTLRAGVTFADGRPITAQDFVYSIERACSPELGSPVATSYLNDIVVVAEFAAGQADHIAGLEALSENELRIQIDAPKAYFLAKLTYPTAFVVDRAQIEKEGDSWQRQPNGSGPFVLESLSKDRIVLTRNARYYRGAPALERVEYVLSGGSPMTMYENDQLDIVEVSAYEIERVLDPDNPLNADLHKASELSVEYLGLNVNLPPFDDPAVRQAFAQAIDKEKLAGLVLNDTATPARSILPPAMPDFDPAFVGLSYDPEKARQLLASSRYGQEGKMPPVVLAISGTSGEMPATTRAVLGMIEENLGITVTVEQVDWPDYLNDMNEQRYQMFEVGWIADYPDSQNFLDILFHSASTQNHTGYKNAEVDRLLEQARVERDPAQRTALYRQAETIIVSEAPWIPLTHGVTYALAKPYVKGYEPSAAIYPWLLDVSIEK